MKRSDRTASIGRLRWPTDSNWPPIRARFQDFAAAPKALKFRSIAPI